MLFRPLRPFGTGGGAIYERSERHAVPVFLTKEHLRKMIDDHLLKEDEIDDQVKVARVMQKLLDSALGFPEKPWHDWDEWVKELE
jgi:hypothetical protein